MGILSVFRKKKTDTVIEKAIAAVADLQKLTEATAYFRGLCGSVDGFQMLDSLTFQYKDYMINAGVFFTLQAHAKGLEAVRDLGLSCAPEYISFTMLKNDTDCVLITRIPGLKGQRLLPFRENRHAVTEKMRKRFLADISTMSSHHRVPTAIYDPETWYLLPSADTILLNRFSPMAAVTWTTKEEYEAISQKIQEQVKSSF